MKFKGEKKKEGVFTLSWEDVGREKKNETDEKKKTKDRGENTGKSGRLDLSGLQKRGGGGITSGGRKK